MPATFRAAGSLSTAAGTSASFSPTMPAGFVAGDLLVGIACNGNGDVPTGRPSGSTALVNVDDGSVFNMDVVWKIAVGSDVFTWTSAAAIKWAAVVYAITVGTFNAGTPIQASPVTTVLGTTAGTTVALPGNTPATADSLMLVAFGAQTTGTWTCNQTSPTMVEVADLSSSGTNPVSLGAYRAGSAAPVSAVTRTGTTTVSTANGGGVGLYVQPATAGASSPRPPRRQRPQFKR
jgi:hypothetical protein